MFVPVCQNKYISNYVYFIFSYLRRMSCGGQGLRDEPVEAVRQAGRGQAPLDEQPGQRRGCPRLVLDGLHQLRQVVVHLVAGHLVQPVDGRLSHPAVGEDGQEQLQQVGGVRPDTG